METICQTSREWNFEAEWQRRLEILSKSREPWGNWVKRNVFIRVKAECIAVVRSCTVNRVRRELAFRGISVTYHLKVAKKKVQPASLWPKLTWWWGLTKSLTSTVAQGRFLEWQRGLNSFASMWPRRQSQRGSMDHYPCNSWLRQRLTG